MNKPLIHPNRLLKDSITQLDIDQFNDQRKKDGWNAFVHADYSFNLEFHEKQYVFTPSF